MRRTLLAGLCFAIALVAPTIGSAQPAWTSNYFHSPSGNIRCREFVNADLMACLTLNDHYAVFVPLHGKAGKERNVSANKFPRGPTLGYGEKWSDPGRFRCISRQSGMTCKSIPTGHGFFIERFTYSLF